ncbi:MAG: hypothetical protein RMJ98_22750, partial [Myxococcales bacterium]|nr:hypothetical protein [Myxococcales bacterium]
MRRGPVLVLLLAPRLGHAQGVEEVLRGGQEALRSGAIREAIERYEAFADQGGLHPDVSYSRGVAYLARVKEGA